MTKSKDVYVTIVNVQKEMTVLKNAIPYIFSFVEIRAELMSWKGDEPQYSLTINNLNIIDAQNIIWEKFALALYELISNHFKEQNQNNGTSRGITSLSR